MSTRSIIIGLAVCALVLLLTPRLALTLLCYYHETRGSVNILSDKGQVMDACTCNHLLFPFCG